MSLAVVLVAIVVISGADIVRATATFDLSVEYPSGTAATVSGKVNLTTQMPVAQQGTVTQEIVQTIDPSKLKLTGVSDIRYPSGWVLSFSFDGSNWTTTEPTTASGTATSWDKVVAVKAAGPIVSQGESNGFQIAEGSASGQPVAVISAALATTGSIGDPHYTFFNASRTLAFFVAHAAVGNILGCTVIATNATCNGFPFNMGVKPDTWAIGKVINNRLWFPGDDGLACVDIRELQKNPSTATATSCGVYSWFAQSKTNLTGGWAAVEEQQIWAFNADTASFICFDTATRQSCGEIQTVATRGGTTFTFHKEGDFLYANSSKNLKQMLCYRVSTAAPCPGFPKTLASDMGRLASLPDANGNIVAVCQHTHGCFDFAGNAFTAPTSFVSSVLAPMAEFATVVGTRVYTSNRLASGGTPQVVCWDAAKNAGAGGPCYGSSTSFAIANYTVTPDPIVEQCLWITNHNSPFVRTYDMSAGTFGCSPPTKVLTLAGSTVVPRMACGSVDGVSVIREWRSINLTTPAPSDYTSVTLSISSSAGNSLTGWQQIPVASWPLNLSSLNPADTGSSPQFTLTFTGLSASVSNASITLSAVGDAPEMCLTPQSTLDCPPIGTGLGYVTGLPVATTTVVSSTGRAIDANSNSTSLGPTSRTVNLGAPDPTDCGGEIKGTARRAGTNAPLANVVVTLMDYTNNTPVNGPDGRPITATTDANGNYSFPNLKPNGRYKTSFASLSDGAAASGTQYVDTGLGVAGTNSATNESTYIELVAGQTDVVDATYPSPAAASPDTSSGLQGVAQTVTPATNDSPNTGATLSASSARLCGPTETPKPGGAGCASTSYVVAGKGVYTVNTTTGALTFTPCNTTAGSLTVSGTPHAVGCTGTPFVGVAPPATYQINTNTSASKPTISFASSTYTPTVVGAPTASADTSTGAFGVVQTKNLLANDAAAIGATLTASSVKLCAANETAPSCTQTSLSVTGVGSYSVDSSGMMTFTPVAGYVGTPAPVPYTVTDSLGQKATSTYTPTVALPAAPTASPEQKPVLPGSSVNFTKLLGSGGLASGTNLQTGATNGPCLVAAATTVPATGCVASLTTADGTWTIDRTTGVATYTANAGVASGAQQAVTYRVTDAFGQTATSLLTPVVPVAPTVRNDVSSGPYGEVQIIDVLGNDSVEPPNALVPGSLKLCRVNPAESVPNCSQTSLTTTEGTYEVITSGAEAGKVKFTPASGYSGTPSTSVKYQVSDAVGATGSATVTVTVAPLAPPTAYPDTSSALAGVTQNVDPLANDVLGGASSVVQFRLTSVKLCGANEVAPNCSKLSLTTADGEYTVDGTTGGISFAPRSGFVGTVTQPVTYQVTDTAAQSAWSTYTPTVVGPPAASPDTSVGPWNTAQTKSLLTNDTAATGATLTASSMKLCAANETAPSCAQTSLSVTGVGSYSVDSLGTVTFTPVAGYAGTPAPLPYTVTDSLGQKATSTYTPTVSPPSAPVATSESKSVIPGGSVSFTNVVGSTPSPTALASGTQLQTGTTSGPYFVCPVSGATTCTTSSIVIPGEGLWSMNRISGIATFMAEAGVSGTLTTVTYRVTDVVGQTATAELTPVVPPPPTLSIDTSRGEQGRQQVLSLLGNDRSGDPSAVLDPTSVKLCPLGTATNCSLSSLAVPGEGTYMVNANGTVSFVPDPSFVGNATVVTYEVADALGQIASSTIAIEVLPPPAMSATTDTATAGYGQSATFRPWLNDSPGTTPASVTQPVPNVLPASLRLCEAGQSAPNCTATTVTTADGTYTVDTGTGEVTFAPRVGFSGVATQPVTYQISNDWTGATGASTSTAILIPTIAAPGQPVAVNDQDETTDAEPVTVAVAANDVAGSAALDPTSVRLCGVNDVAPDCSATTVTTAEGTFTVDIQSGKVVFVPGPGFDVSRPATINYVVSDSNGSTTSATLTIVRRSAAAKKDPSPAASQPGATPGQTATDRDGTGAVGATSTQRVAKVTKKSVSKANGQIVRTGAQGVMVVFELAVLALLAGCGLILAGGSIRSSSVSPGHTSRETHC